MYVNGEMVNGLRIISLTPKDFTAENDRYKRVHDHESNLVFLNVGMVCYCLLNNNVKPGIQNTVKQDVYNNCFNMRLCLDVFKDL